MRAFFCIVLVVTGTSASTSIVDVLQAGIESYWNSVYDVIEELAARDPETTPVEVCYDYVGCFVRENGNYRVGIFPDDPENVAAEFLLYTEKDQSTPETLSYKNANSITDSSFIESSPVKFIIHGFFESSTPKWIKNMRNAFFDLNETTNVIVVDWGKAACCDYVQSSADTETVGREVALLINSILSSTSTTLDDVHVVGFSLGAQIAGAAGKYIQTLTGGQKIARITGLDPAGPLFCYRGNVIGNTRLLPDDAEYVDVIHTNGGQLSTGHLGCLNRSGQVDFYPNGGDSQKACSNALYLSTSILKDTHYFVCQHVIATEYYIETLTSKSLTCSYGVYSCPDTDSFSSYTQKCTRCTGNCNQMGYYSQPIADDDENKYIYLQTGYTMPLCKAS